ncbi:serine O-acetyltransferase [Paraburkholderia domus]|uniref:serine O-acetyltransferase n=1 Tax=Paraburkholderia domus TaxID=2793075 RepID=UPI001912EB01|nr:DapH/DapD/GlmU-related protein [Paraburkholderia domus]MBK5065935.1 serine acetyltransferase [Burkholderia sp. R-70199]CAE6964436.1 2,3,4,5-tetrahydropyridine-2,6-dicarboxylate N-acetyltransferase [Paraburkholderia domus]
MTPINLIKSDLFRYAGNTRLVTFAKKYLSCEGFNYMVWFRLANGYRSGPVGIVLKQLLRQKQRSFGIVIPVGCKIGPGFFIGHFGNIVLNETVVVGSNCNISQGVTIGSNEGQAATIGDNVYIGPNVCIVEAVRVGNDVTIGAGSVVTREVRAGTTVAGVPAKVISDDIERGRAGRYITRRWADARGQYDSAGHGI